MTATYDAIVIGAGHNGLTFATYLARAGLSVTVMEAGDDIGGLTVTQEVTLPGFRSDLHAFGYQFASLSPAPEELELARHGLELVRPDIAFAHLFPDGGTVHMGPDVDATATSIASWSDHDASRWRELYERWRSAKEGIRAGLNDAPRPLSAELAELEATATGMDQYRFSQQSMRSWTNEWFDRDEIRMFLGAFSLHANMAPDEVGGGQLSWLFDSLIQDHGNQVVRGGMAGVPRALAAALTEHGGEVRTGARVAQVLVEDGRARGVRLVDGEEVPASRLVAANLDPVTLVTALLEPEVAGAGLLGRARNYEWGDSIMVIYLALDRPLAPSGSGPATEACYLHCCPPSLEYVTRMFAEARSGLLPREPVMIVCNDSAADPTRMPDGRGLAKVLVKCVPYDIRGDAGGTITARRWAEAKEAYADRVMDLLERHYLPGLGSSVLARVVHSPVDQERHISSAVRGTELQGAFLPYQSGAMRPFPEMGNYRATVPGLYLCGAGSHPGPGVSFMPGRNSARAALGDLGIDPARAGMT